MLTLEATSAAAPADPLDLAPPRIRIMWLIALVIAGCFYGIEHSSEVEKATLETFTITGDEMAARAEEGSPQRRLSITALGLFGMFLLIRRDGAHMQLRSGLGWLLLSYLVCCGLSVLWSVNQPITIRHFGVLFFCCVGALGVARQVTLRELCMIALIVSTILVGYSLYCELAAGTFRPFDSDYRFAGKLHPNAQSPYCATMALSAACLAIRTKHSRLLLWSLCAAGASMLILTKSRTVCGAFLAGLLAFTWFGSSWPKRILAVTAVVWVACMLVLGTIAMGVDVERQVVNMVLIGREDDNEALSGRIPLWSELIPHIEERPLLGHGYHTFWDPNRIETFSRNFQFMLSDGHSAYLDSALDLGLLGATLCVLAVFAGLSEVGRRYFATNEMGYGFLFALLACRSLNGLLESAFANPTAFPPFIMVVGLAHLGFCVASEPIDASDEPPREAIA